MKPIFEFKDDKQLNKVFKKWKKILGLYDWCIKIVLAAPHEFEEEGIAGECVYASVNRSAMIRIIKPEFYGERVMKYCAERILVHELLHCKFALIDTDDDGFEMVKHQLIDDIANSLVCSKYNIDREDLQLNLKEGYR